MAGLPMSQSNKTVAELLEIAAEAQKAYPGRWISEKCDSLLPDGSPCWCRWVRVDPPLGLHPIGTRDWIVPNGSLAAPVANHLAAFNPDVVGALLRAAKALRGILESPVDLVGRPEAVEMVEALDALAKAGVQL